jgi:sulfur carrier protein ThiS adenylyltransferase
MKVFEEITGKLKNASVGIAGCGGLGSNCAVALARVGVGKLVIADFDVVDQSNLNRQYFFADQVGMKKVDALRENIRRINSAVQVVAHEIELDSQSIKNIYAECDIVVEAFDKAEMKQLIIETVLTEMPGKHIITAVGLAGWGNSNHMKVRRSGRLIICGDEYSEVNDDNPPLAPRVGIAANMQANVVLEILLNKKTESNGDHS